MKIVAFITESGTDIGYGHLYRSIALAHSFLERGHCVHFYTNKESNSIIRSQLIDVKINNEVVYNNGVFDPADIVIFDVHKDSFQRYVLLIRHLENKITVTIIDHVFREAALPSNYVFEIGFQKYKSQEIRRQKGNTLTKYYSGLDYLIFRKEFENVILPPVRKDARNILVTMGGSDPREITEKVAESFELSSNKYNITYVLGDGVSESRIESLKRLHSNTVHQVTYLQGIVNMASVMVKQDCAIINGGNTRFELALIGVPYISVSINEEQANISYSLQNAGIGYNLGVIDQLSTKKMSNEITDFMLDFDLRASMSLVMRSLIQYNTNVIEILI